MSRLIVVSSPNRVPPDTLRRMANEAGIGEDDAVVFVENNSKQLVPYPKDFYFNQPIQKPKDHAGEPKQYRPAYRCRR